MNAVIKAGDRSHGMTIAPLSFKARTARDALEDRPADPRSIEIARLAAALASRDEEIAALRQAVEQARTDGEEAGRAAAELEFEDDRSDQLERLERALAQAGKDAAAFVQQAETLSLLLARAALERMFGEDPDRQDTIARLIRRELDLVQRDTVLAIEVSRLDFPDTGEVASLARRLGLAADVVGVRDDMRAGDCRMRLKLGALEIGPAQQWDAVRRLFDRLADLPEASA